ERLRKALEAKGLQEEAKKHETGHHAVARSYRAPHVSLGAFRDAFCQYPRHRTVSLRRFEVKAATFVDRATGQCTARPHSTVWQN
ncbi:hypothetical protein PIB30_063493, partial [Stylosanthes scabra]|nr:hypothetical protein [Stylosanthes scabra]